MRDKPCCYIITDENGNDIDKSPSWKKYAAASLDKDEIEELLSYFSGNKSKNEILYLRAENPWLKGKEREIKWKVKKK